MSFEGLKVLVTGSTRGIGKAAAQAFLERGSHVAIHGRDSRQVDAVIRELGNENLVAAPGDIGTAQTCHDVVESAVTAMGGLDVLVNNAGVYHGGPIEDMTDDAYTWLMDINVKGCFFCSQAAIPHLRQRNGAIVMIASESGLTGNLNSALYCTSKGAVVNMTRAFAHDLAPTIRVNAVCPGAVQTDMLGPDDPESLRKYSEFSPLKRIASPEEIGEAICFLSDPSQKFMTGALLSIDGGAVACR